MRAGSVWADGHRGGEVGGGAGLRCEPAIQSEVRLVAVCCLVLLVLLLVLLLLLLVLILRVHMQLLVLILLVHMQLLRW